VKELSRYSSGVRHVLDYVKDWRCPSTTQSAFRCLRELVRQLTVEQMLLKDALFVAGRMITSKAFMSHTKDRRSYL
jgi:hypothetical protein